MHTPHLVAVANQKGGVGKTTSAVNLCAVLTEMYQKRTLLLDLDPQGHASRHLGMRVNHRPPVYQVLVEGAFVEDLVQPTPFGFDLLAGGTGTAIADLWLASQQNHEQLGQALAACDGRWDCIVLDCPPSLGNLLLCALACAHSVLVPMPLEFLPVDGLEQLVERIARMRRVNPRLKLAGVFTTKTDERTSIAQLLRAEMSAKPEVPMLDSVVRRNTALSGASWAAKPVTQFAPDSKGAADYRGLVSELVEKGIV